jgi:hypothetical protein
MVEDSSPNQGTDRMAGIEDTARAKHNRLSRAAILEGPKDPDNFIMPGGRTLTETRQVIEKAQREEVEKYAATTQEATRQEGLAGEPMKDDVRFETNEVGVLLQHPLHPPEAAIAIDGDSTTETSQTTGLSGRQSGHPSQDTSENQNTTGSTEA